MKLLFTLGFIINSLVSVAQSKWKPYVGLHGSMDAGGYFVGPSVMVGTDYLVGEKLALSTYFHLFADKLDDTFPDGSFQKGEYRSYILAFMLQKQLAKSYAKGLNVAGGFALQRTTDEYITSFDEGSEKLNMVVAAFRFGYKFPIKKIALNVEINAVGPYVSKVGPAPYYEQNIKLLTQLSLGTRVIF